MLQRKTIEPHTLSLIAALQKKDYLQSFLLVGGTALALQLGHRTSTDIDLFTHKPFNVPDLLTSLELDFNVSVRTQLRHALLLQIDQIKSDFVFQPAELIDKPVQIEGIRMGSLLEIAAMKIGAITARGKKRDFIDIYCLLEYYSLTEMLEAFLRKYPRATPELAIRNLFYFEDAENDQDPVCFFEYNWQYLKDRIRKEARNF